MRSMHKVSIATVLGLLLVTRAGHGVTYVSGAGTACQAQTTDAVHHLANGAANPSTSTTSVLLCPLALGTQTSYPLSHSETYVRYADFSSTDNFWCRAYQGYWDGSLYTSSIKYTCSTAGGCADPTTSYTGSGYINWNTTEMGSGVYNQAVDGNYGFICGVPKNSGGGASFISTYWAQ